MAGMENIYDILAKENEQSRQVGIDYSKIREGGVAAAVMAQAGGMLGGSVMQAAGFKTAGQKTQEGREKLQQMHPNPTTYQDMVAMANDAKNLGLSGDWELIMKRAEAMNTTGKVTAAQQQNLADMDATLDFLEVSKGYKLNPKEAAYFKARIKKDVSLSMSGQVVDTAPNVFDQLISARKGGESSDGGIGDTGLTEAGLEKQVGDLATRVIKADLSGLDTAISQAEEMITSYKGKDIPGLSKMNVMERMTAEGSKNATRVKSVSNILMKLRSGAAVTESEAKRFSEEMSSAPIVTDELWIDWLSRLRLLVDERKRELYAGVPPEVIELYQSRQGKKKDKKSRTPTQAEQEILSKYNLK